SRSSDYCVPVDHTPVSQVTGWSDTPLLPLGLAPRAPEGVDAKVKKQQRERGSHGNSSPGGCTGEVAMVFADRGPAANRGQHQKQEASDLQPKHMHHAAYTGSGNSAGAIDGAHPAVPARLASGHPQGGAALNAKIA